MWTDGRMVCVEISECDIKFLNVMKLHILFSVTYGLELHVSISFLLFM